MPGRAADAWAISNPPILSMTPLLAALGVFDSVTMARARARSVRLTAYLEALLADVATRVDLDVITPSSPEARGCQLSVRVPRDPGGVVATLRRDHGVVADARPPDVVRLAPTPLFSTHVDCLRAARGLEAACR